MEIKITDEQIKSVVSDAILKTMTEEQRNVLIAKAIETLITEQERGSGWDRKKFIPIHEAFNDAARSYAQEIAREYLKDNEEFKSKIKALLAQAMENLFETNKEKVLASITDAFLRGFEKEY